MERSLSALLPVRNVESTLRRTVMGMLDILPELTSRFDLVVVDDCSTDATIEVADELAADYPQLLAMRHSVPQGRAAAIRTGLDQGLGEVVFFADEDCRLALDQVRRLWGILGEYEVVRGRPWDEVAEVTKAGAAVSPGGGYQMGFRSAFRRVADALADPATLAATLLRCGIPWHEVHFSSGLTGRGPDPWTASLSHAALGGSGFADRSVRTDRPENSPGGARQPNYLVRHCQLAADE